MLIAKPTAEERKLARTNGQRNLSLSAKWANSSETIARGRSLVRLGPNIPRSDSLAATYGGTVRRSETTAEYPNP